jgi:hypothetical protein
MKRCLIEGFSQLLEKKKSVKQNGTTQSKGNRIFQSRRRFQVKSLSFIFSSV